MLAINDEAVWLTDLGFCIAGKPRSHMIALQRDRISTGHKKSRFLVGRGIFGFTYIPHRGKGCNRKRLDEVFSRINNASPQCLFSQSNAR